MRWDFTKSIQFRWLSTFDFDQSNYPIKTGEYNTDDLDCGDLDEGDDNACYLELFNTYGFFDFSVWDSNKSIEGKFNLSTLSDNKISFNYDGKIEVTDPLDNVLGEINVTLVANNIPYEDNYWTKTNTLLKWKKYYQF